MKYTKPTTLSAVIAAATLMTNTVYANQSLPQKYTITTDYAESIAKAAIVECKKSKANPSISIVNDQGILVYFYRGDNSGSNTVHTSYRKAYTSATLKMATSGLSHIVESEGYSQLGKMEDDILLLTGGLPIFYENQLVGAIGLSGSPSPALEEGCGKKALEAHQSTDK
ncbi:heme-binding protein [Thalassomonas sp. RHCl1]|uniref:GlcG/HbpS family heme-binding protein n=1 Tax=Thalassomonas sp. RHCl1 TaxID=2995320 RepID=UPI00248C2B01|nr:heme-binding protein [Thalassomonas sp. RHCl1]